VVKNLWTNKVDQARCLKELKRENMQLKRTIADLTLDKLILKEAAQKNSKHGTTEKLPNKS